MRIAMWSGPRNISTALMRSFGSRADTFVCDEPLYGHYLSVTGRPHPGAAEIMASQDTDWRAVAAWLTGPIPDGRTVFYQKHMAHHLLDVIGRDWLAELTHVFLIRDPREMLTSLLRVFPDAELPDTGLPQQVALFESERARLGQPPPVIRCRDVLAAPEAMLRALCAAIGLPFDAAMLSWEPGPRDTDGVWARHWYGRVEQTTGFAVSPPKGDPIPDAKAAVYADCVALYNRLEPHRLRPQLP